MSSWWLLGTAGVLFAVWWDNFSAPNAPVPASPRIEVFLDRAANTTSEDVGKLRVAVGYNANLDILVGMPVLEELLQKYPAPESFQDHEQISSVEELFSSFGYWFSRGGAAERYVSSPEVFSELLRVCRATGGVTALGGNAGLMANNLAEDGHTVLLGATYDEQVRNLLNPKAEFADTSTKVPEGELEGLNHIILEYPKGATIFGFVAPRANRLILIRDLLNSRLESLGSFHSRLLAFRPDVVIVSGLHLLAGLPPEVQERHLKEVANGLMSIPRSLPIHLELASMADKGLVALAVHNILPLVDSLGLNEQELNATMIALDSELAAVMNADSKGVSAALEALHAIFANFRFPAWPDHYLTRIHFHCLGFHVVASRGDILERNRWTQANFSVFQGSRAASIRACGTDGVVSPQDVDLLFSQQLLQVKVGNERFGMNAEEPVTAFELAAKPGVAFAVAPVAVCKKPSRTVGLGDAISSAGLVNHLRIT